MKQVERGDTVQSASTDILILQPVTLPAKQLKFIIPSWGRGRCISSSSWYCCTQCRCIQECTNRSAYSCAACVTRRRWRPLGEHRCFEVLQGTFCKSRSSPQCRIYSCPDKSIKLLHGRLSLEPDLGTSPPRRHPGGAAGTQRPPKRLTSPATGTRTLASNF